MEWEPLVKVGSFMLFAMREPEIDGLVGYHASVIVC